MNTASQTTRVSSKLYERLLLLYPHAYLKKHRAELLQNFEDAANDAPSVRVLWLFIISDFMTSLVREYMHYIKNHRWIQIALALVVILFIYAGSQVLMLQKAHSTFDNYAAFRGCTHITSRTDSVGRCVTDSGQSVTIVKFDNRWFLQGDLPVCMINIGSFCLVDQP